MKSLSEIFKLSTDFLAKQGIENPRKIAERVLCDALQLQRIQLYTESDRPLTEKELELCRQVLSRAAKGEPYQYIHGTVDFYHCTIRVNRSVLIPRQETEILVDKIATQLAREDLVDKCLWDLCCGSGCIGIALKKKFPQLQVASVDISPEALAVAQENAQFNGVSIDFYQGDLLAPFKGKKVDFVVANPPYIAEVEWANLDTSVRDFEPKLALVGGPTGLLYYERLAKELPPFLKPHAKVWFEIGSGQGQALLKLFSVPPWQKSHFEADWAGQDRFFFLEME